MNNFEQIKKMNEEELADLLCGLTDCNKCIMQDECTPFPTGYMIWLKEEEEETTT